MPAIPPSSISWDSILGSFLFFVFQANVIRRIMILRITPTSSRYQNRRRHLCRRPLSSVTGQYYCPLITSPLALVRFYLFPFNILCVLHSIWQLDTSVAPPFDQAVTWSASISASFQILLLFAPFSCTQCGQFEMPCACARAVWRV